MFVCLIGSVSLIANGYYSFGAWPYIQQWSYILDHHQASNLSGFIDCKRRLLTQRPLLYCHHCSNPGLPIDCHDWLLPLHTIAIIRHHHSLLHQQNFWVKKSNSRLPIGCQDRLPPLHTIAWNHSLFHQHMAPRYGNNIWAQQSVHVLHQMRSTTNSGAVSGIG